MSLAKEAALKFAKIAETFVIKKNPKLLPSLIAEHKKSLGLPVPAAIQQGVEASKGQPALLLKKVVEKKPALTVPAR